MAIDYQELLDTAMLRLVRQALTLLQENKVTGEHHFYISFKTDYPGVILSERMRQKYPKEITIVLQHQFEELNVQKDYFSVRVSFGGIKEVIRVPFAALTNFVDPSAKFSLQFTPKLQQHPLIQLAEASRLKNEAIPKTKPEEAVATNVIALDAFRKQK